MYDLFYILENRLHRFSSEWLLLALNVLETAGKITTG